MYRKEKSIMLKKAFYAAVCTAFLFMAAVPVSVMATDSAETDDWTENEITNSFYMPKAAFQTVYDYEEYCERMYKNGYMDEQYNWTDEALDYINNPTKEKSEALDKSAKALVESRIAEGKMDAADNPFLTYEERMALQDDNAGDSTGDSEGNAEDGVDESTGSMTETITESITEAGSDAEIIGGESVEETGLLTEEDMETETTAESEDESETETDTEAEAETIETKSGFLMKVVLAAVLTILVFSGDIFYIVWLKRH